MSQKLYLITMLKVINSDIYEYNEKNRILKYYISDNKIYASVIKDIDIEDNLFNWELVSYDLNFKNKKILNSGVIVSPFVFQTFIMTTIIIIFSFRH